MSHIFEITNRTTGDARHLARSTVHRGPEVREHFMLTERFDPASALEWRWDALNAAGITGMDVRKARMTG